MTAPATPAQPPAAPRPWRRRLRRAVVIFIVACIVFRIAVFFLFPVVLRRTAASYGLACSYGRIDLSLLGTDVGIWNLQFTPMPASGRSAAPSTTPAPAQPLIRSEYVRARISTLALLIGRLHVLRLEADGAEVLVDRLPDGRIPLLDRFVSHGAAAPSVPKTGPIDLSSPLRIDALRVEHFIAHVRDRAVIPNVDTRLDLELRITDLGNPTRPTRCELNAQFARLVDHLTIRIDGTSHQRHLEARIQVALQGLHPKPMAGYLAALGLSPQANNISGRLDFRVQTKPLPAPADGVSAMITCDDANLSADDRESIGLDHLVLKARSIDRSGADFAGLTIEGLRFHGLRTPSGLFALAGLCLNRPPVPAAASQGPATRSAPARLAAASPTPRPRSASQRPPYRVSLQELFLRRCVATFDDDAVNPPAHLEFDLDELTCRNLTGKPLGPDTTITIAGFARAPGIARSLQLQGQLTPIADHKSLALKLKVEGIKLDALRPYLAAAGLESQYVNGLLTADINGTFSSAQGPLTGQATIKDIRLEDGGRELFSIPSIRLAGVHIATAPLRPHFDLIEITGPALTAHRDADGTLSFLGLRTLPAAAGGNPPGAPASTPAAAAALPAARSLAPPKISLPALEINHLTWDKVRLDLEDRTTKPATHIRITDAAFNLRNLAITPDGTPDHPATLDASLAAPGLADHLTLQGSLTPHTHSLAGALTVQAAGVNALPLAPYLRPLGIEPTLHDGSLAAQFSASANSAGGVLKAAFSLRHLQYKDGPTELASLAGLDCSDIVWTPAELSIGSVVIDHPAAVLARDRDHALAVAGVRLLPTVEPGRRQPDPASAPLVVLVKSFTVKSAAFALTDHAAPGSTPVHTVATADLQLSHLTLGRPAPAAQLDLSAALSGIADHITLRGTLGTAPDNQSAKLALDVTGLRQGPAGAYLPPGTSLTLTHGHLAAQVDALWAVDPAGGHTGHLALTDVDLSDGPTTTSSPAHPLFHFDRAGITLDRFDPTHSVIDIGRIDLAGLQTSAIRQAGGALQLAALRLGSTPPSQSATAPAAAPAHRYSLPPRFPPVHIQQVDLQASSFTFRDESRPGSAPLFIRHVRLRTLAPVSCLGDQPDAQPPIRLELTAAADPIADHLMVDVTSSPFTLRRPEATINFALTGIHGSGLVALAPQLGHRINGAGLSHGVLSGELSLRTIIDRRSPLDFALVRPFDADLTLRHLRFQAQPQGMPLAGLEELRAESARVDPATATIDVKTLELTRPQIRVIREPDGIHALGLVLKVPAATTPPGASPRQSFPAPITQPAAGPSKSGPLLPTTQPAPAPPRLTVHIARLTISGLDAQFEDRTAQPVLVVPLTGMEFDAYDLSSDLLSNPHPFRYSLLLTAGNTPLEGRDPKSPPVDRALFAEVTSTGRLALAPHPTGYLKVSVSGFELASLRGLAKEYGVTLTGGVLDEDLEDRFRPDGSGSLSTNTVITDLSLTEPPNGPIARFFQLPAPLDVAIAAIQAPDGSITLPVAVPLKGYRFGPDDVMLPAVGAVTQAVAVGIASSPLKLAGGLLGARPDVQRRIGSVTLNFAPGSTVLDAPSAAALKSLLRRLQDDDHLALEIRHEFAPGDLSRAALRANPDPADALSIVQMLRRKRADLLNLRVQVAGQSRAALAANPDPAANRALFVRLRAIDVQIAETQEALDLAADYFRPGAALQADRRTRAAALQLARQRLDLVSGALTAADIPELNSRMILATPQLKPVPGATAGRIIIDIVRRK